MSYLNPPHPPPPSLGFNHCTHFPPSIPRPHPDLIPYSLVFVSLWVYRCDQKNSAKLTFGMLSFAGMFLLFSILDSNVITMTGTLMFSFKEKDISFLPLSLDAIKLVVKYRSYVRRISFTLRVPGNMLSSLKSWCHKIHHQGFHDVRYYDNRYLNVQLLRNGYFFFTLGRHQIGVNILVMSDVFPSHWRVTRVVACPSWIQVLEINENCNWIPLGAIHNDTVRD